MAAEHPSFYLLLLVVAPLLYLAVARWRSSSSQRLPPSPWALPVIGHLRHLAGALPHRALRDLARRHGPLMLLRFGEVPVVVASSPDAAREIMKTHDVAFATRPLGLMLRRVFQGADGLVFVPYGDAWRQLRKICTVELLSSRRVHSFSPVREDELGILLRSVASEASAARPVNLSERIAAFVADSSVRAIIGSRSADRDTFLRLLEEAFKVIPGMSLPDVFPSSRLAMRLSRVPGEIERRRSAMFGIIDTIIQEHQENRAAAAEDHEDLPVHAAPPCLARPSSSLRRTRPPPPHASVSIRLLLLLLPTPIYAHTPRPSSPSVVSSLSVSPSIGRDERYSICGRGHGRLSRDAGRGH